MTVNLDVNASANTNLTFSLSQVQNPLATIPTSSFSISTYYNSSDSLVDTMSSGLTFTGLPNPIKEVTVTPSSLTVGAVTSYVFKINFTNPVPAGTVFAITFPAAIPLNSPSFPATDPLPCVASSTGQVVTLSGCITTQTSN